MSQLTSSEPPIKLCRSCGKCQDKMEKCGICKQKYKINSYYCCKDCQTSDWPKHKQFHKEKDAERQKDAEKLDELVNSEDAASTVATDRNIDQRDENGMTMLSIMSYNGKLKEVRELLKQGANPLLTDNQGLTPLNYAIAQRHLNVVKELVQNSPKELLLIGPSQWKRSPCTFQAACVGNFEILKVLLDAGGEDLLYMRDTDGRTCLHIACKMSRKDIVLELLERGGTRLLEIADLDGLSCLYAASDEGFLDIVRILVERDNGLLVKSPKLGGWHAFHAACSRGRTEVVKVLLKVGGQELLSRTDPVAGPALYNAAAHGHLDVVKELVKVGGESLVMERAADSCTALHAATIKGRTEVAKYLIKVGGRELVHAVGVGSATALHVAAAYGHDACAKLLIKHGGSELMMAEDASGATPLYMACQNGHAAVVKVMCGAGVTELLQKAKPNEGTPLHAACARKHPDVVRLLVRHCDPVVFYAKDVLGLNVLQTACKSGVVESVNLILDAAGKDILFDLSAAGVSCLTLASACGHVDVVRELVKRGGDALINTPSIDGSTPASVAQENNQTEILEILEHGCTNRQLLSSRQPAVKAKNGGRVSKCITIGSIKGGQDLSSIKLLPGALEALMMENKSSQFVVRLRPGI